MIEAKQVRYGIRSREILRGVDFRVEKGEFVGLIGPNGSGKSTFLKNVYKVLRPQAGELTLMGDDLLAMSNREMAQRLAVMVQEQEAAFDFTVEEVVMMGRQARKRLLETDSREDRALVGEILARTGLASLREQGFSTLSGGEKQRVLIARALAQQTAVLVLDEPTNHLDIKYQLQLMELVRGSGCTVVAAIHDLNLAAAYCHRLYALKDGVIVGEGAPKELLTPAFLREVYEVRRRCSPDGTAPCGCSFTRPAYHKNGPRAAPGGRFILPASRKPGGGCRPPHRWCRRGESRAWRSDGA